MYIYQICLWHATESKWNIDVIPLMCMKTLNNWNDMLHTKWWILDQIYQTLKTSKRKWNATLLRKLSSQHMVETPSNLGKPFKIKEYLPIIQLCNACISFVDIQNYPI